MFVPMLVSLALSMLLSGRTVGDYQTAGAAMAAHPVAVWFGRLTTLFVLLAAAERVYTRITSLPLAIDRARLLLLLGFVSYWMTNVALPAIWGAKPDVSHEYLYALVIGCGVLSMARDEATRTVELARTALLCFIGAGVVALAFQPSLVLDYQYRVGIIPGLQIRFAGLAPHSNSLGPLVVVALLCLWAKPYRAAAVNWGAWIIGLAALVLSQSKTSWAAFALCALFVAAIRHGRQLRASLGQRQHSNAWILTLVLAIGVLASLSVLVVIGEPQERLGRFFRGEVGYSLLALTDRPEIWAVALNEWARHPVFGYGPAVFDLQHRISSGAGMAAYHAHNQVVQVLAQAGTVGLVGFSAYALILSINALRYSPFTNGLSGALLLLLVLRGLTEVPMTILGYGPEQLIQFLLLAVIAGALPATQREGLGASVSRVTPRKLMA
jgi:exopolysaccharide production protein ExoQ